MICRKKYAQGHYQNQYFFLEIFAIHKPVDLDLLTQHFAVFLVASCSYVWYSILLEKPFRSLYFCLYKALELILITTPITAEEDL